MAVGSGSMQQQWRDNLEYQMAIYGESVCAILILSLKLSEFQLQLSWAFTILISCQIGQGGAAIAIQG